MKTCLYQDCYETAEKFSKYCENHSLLIYLEENSDKKLNNIEVNNGVILKRAKDKTFKKYKYSVCNLKIVCSKKNCFLFVKGRSQFCKHHYENTICGWDYGEICKNKSIDNSFFCDEHIKELEKHTKNIKLTKHEEKNNIFLKKSSIGIIQKYICDGSIDRKICLRANCLKIEMTNSSCIFHQNKPKNIFDKEEYIKNN